MDSATTLPQSLARHRNDTLLPCGSAGFLLATHAISCQEFCNTFGFIGSLRYPGEEGEGVAWDDEVSHTDRKKRRCIYVMAAQKEFTDEVLFQTAPDGSNLSKKERLCSPIMGLDKGGVAWCPPQARLWEHM